MSDEYERRARELAAERLRPEPKPTETDELLGELIAAIAQCFTTPPDQYQGDR